MEIWFDLVLWIHLIAVAVAVGGGAALGFVGPAIAAATAEQRMALGPVRRRIFDVVTIAVIVLVISGPLMIWIRYGTDASFSGWFWAKMALVVLLLALNLVSRGALKRAEGGDMAAGARLRWLGLASGVTGVLTILAAVLTFG